MPSSRSIIIRRGTIALMAAFAAGVIGYGTGHSTKRLPNSTTNDSVNSRSTEAVDHQDPAGKASALDRAAHLAKLKQRLIREWRASPEPLKDFELMDKAHRQLSSLSARELADFYHSLVSQFMPDIRLRQTVLKEWALKDGPAAVTESELDRWSHSNTITAFETWGYQDPQKALAWLREAELPPFLKDQKLTIRLNFLPELAQTDFRQVLEELSHLDAKERAAIVRNLGSAIEKHPEFLEEIRELTKSDSDPASLLALERVLISQQAKNGPAAALEYIAGLNLPPADKAELELDLFRQDFDQPEKSFGDWLARNPDIESVPDSFWPMMDIRYTLHPEEMTRWLDSLSPGPLRDAFYERGTRLVASQNKYDKAAIYADGISDPEKRLSAMRTLRTMWTETQADNARAWLDRLPEADRKALGK
jgi:hypothetical protein